jgi:hypothetical protein
MPNLATSSRSDGAHQEDGDEDDRVEDGHELRAR